MTHLSQSHEPTEARKAFGWLAKGSSSVRQSPFVDRDRAFRNCWANSQFFHRPTWHKAGKSEGFYIGDLSVRKLDHKCGEVHVPKAGWIRFRPKRTSTETEASTSAQITLDRSGKWHESFTQPLARGAVENPGWNVVRKRGLGGSISGSKNILAAGLAVPGRRGMAHAMPIQAEHSGPVKRQPLEEGRGMSLCLRKGSHP